MEALKGTQGPTVHADGWESGQIPYEIGMQIAAIMNSHSVPAALGVAENPRWKDVKTSARRWRRFGMLRNRHRQGQSRHSDDGDGSAGDVPDRPALYRRFRGWAMRSIQQRSTCFARIGRVVMMPASSRMCSMTGISKPTGNRRPRLSSHFRQAARSIFTKC